LFLSLESFMRVFFAFTICLTILLFVSACKDEEPDGPSSLIDECKDILTAQSEIENADIQSNLVIVSINENTEGVISLLYDNETSLHICPDQLSTFTVDTEAWNVHLAWADDSETEAVFLGDQLELSLLEASYAPLSRKLEMDLPVPASVHIQVSGQDGSESDMNHTTELYDIGLQEIPLMGLYPDSDNSISISILSQSGYILYSEDFIVSTSSVPESFPTIDVIEMNTSEMADGYTLVSYRSSFSPNIPFMIDPWGKIRWYLDYTDHPELNLLHYDVGVERLANGNYYFGNRNSSIVYEVTILGEVINSWPLGSLNMHHQTKEKSDGNFLVCASDPTSLHENGFSAIDDHILELDRSTGAILYVWDLKNILDEHRTALIDETQTSPVDWAHINSVWHDESDNSIIASVLNQGVVKFDYSGQIKWIVSNHSGWNQNRVGQDLNDYLLTAVDASGIAYSDSVQMGFLNAENFEWPWFQHAVKLTTSGSMSLFDNGDSRNFEAGPSGYSRAVEYVIDEENMTIRQNWTYGKERGWDTFSNCCSDVDFISGSNNVLFGPGDTRLYQGSGNYASRIIELDYDSKNVLWEVFMDSPWIGFHRVERLTLYP